MLRNLRFFLFASAMAFVMINAGQRKRYNARQKETYEEWLSNALSSNDGQWQLLTSAMSNADKRSRAKAITTIKNTKYAN